MRIHYLQHVPYEGLGSIEKWVQKKQHQLSSTKFFRESVLPDLSDFDFLIVMGGPMNIYDTKKYPWLTEEKEFILKTVQSKTVLGICLGAQLIADVLGAKITANAYKEIGWFPITKSPQLQASPLSKAFPEQLEAFHWHGDTFSLPKNSIPVAGSEACANQGFFYDDRVLGLQFHLETTPQSAKELIDHCADEIIDAPFIQSPEIMLADEKKFKNINRVMEDVLQYLFSTPTTRMSF